MKRRNFQTQALMGGIMTTIFLDENPNQYLLSVPNLLCLWDFDRPNDLTSKGMFDYELLEINGEIERAREGILSDWSLDILENQYLTIPRLECPGLNIRGMEAQVTVLAWVKRKPKLSSPDDCEAIAGMWNETQRNRQYCLFLNIRLHGSSDQVCGHISGVGSPTLGEKWCVDVSLGQQSVLYDEWTFVAMTYDGQQIRSYLNGEIDARLGRNPYPYELGIFNGGESGSDFTIGAVHRLGQMGNNFAGKLGGLAIFDRAISEKEISQIHSNYPLSET
jgi:hypothetical protein